MYTYNDIKYEFSLKVITWKATKPGERTHVIATMEFFCFGDMNSIIRLIKILQQLVALNKFVWRELYLYILATY